MTTITLLWHDYETTGADPRRDRPVQFAALRTDLALDPIGEPVRAMMQPAPDVLTHPDAVLITGITPQQAAREGLPEVEFAARVHEVLAEPGTCAVGYNSIRFDDEFTRHLLYRNFHDPYEREWRNDNSRWDLLDVVRSCYALRPAGLEWPLRDDGTPSFRLEDLCAANGVPLPGAHDALADASATLELARRLRRAQPRLFEYLFQLRDKRRVLELLDWKTMAPVLHVSGRYPARRGCLALVAPLAPLPEQPNAIVVVDLDADPGPLLALPVDALRERVFTRSADLPEDAARVPLKLVRANRAPVLAPLSVLAGVDRARIGLDLERGLAHLERLRAADGLAAKARAVFADEGPRAPSEDPELALYDGFPSDADKALCRAVRAAPPERLEARHFPFQDPRYRELLFRYRARNWPESLDADARERWRRWCRARLEGRARIGGLGIEAWRARIAALRADPATAPRDQALLDQLEAWGEARYEETAP